MTVTEYILVPTAYALYRNGKPHSLLEYHLYKNLYKYHFVQIYKQTKGQTMTITRLNHL